MKFLKFTYLLLLLTSFTFMSCEDEPLTGTFTDEIAVDEDGDGDIEIVEPFFAKVDGEEFIEETLEAYVFNGKLYVRAYDAADNAIIIGLPEDVSETSSDFNGAEYTATFEDTTTTPNTFTTADTGSVTIVTHNVDDKLIEGTFNFVSTPGASASPQYTISEGSFSVNY